MRGLNYYDYLILRNMCGKDRPNSCRTNTQYMHVRMRNSHTGQLTHCSMPCPVSARAIINHNLRKETSLP